MGVMPQSDILTLEVTLVGEFVLKSLAHYEVLIQ